MYPHHNLDHQKTQIIRC